MSKHYNDPSDCQRTNVQIREILNFQWPEQLPSYDWKVMISLLQETLNMINTSLN